MSDAAALVARVVLKGDLAGLSDIDRTLYYREVCASLGLNPLTKPFEYLRLNGALRLYATKDCTDQLRASRGVSIPKLDRELVDDVWVVTAYAKLGDREDSSTGAVSIAGLRGADKANAFMKAETKAKRRVTLSICGLGMMDDSEVDATPGAERVNVETGEVEEGEPPPERGDRVALDEGRNLDAEKADLLESIRKGFNVLGLSEPARRAAWGEACGAAPYLTDAANLTDLQILIGTLRRQAQDKKK